MHKGFKEFREIAIGAIFKEFNKLDKVSQPNKDILVPINLDKLSTEEIE